MQFSMQFYVDRGPGLFGAMRLSFARLDGTGRRLQTQNLPGITPREGSIPFTGTKNCIALYLRLPALA
jgi:hypothetical protein